MPAWRYISSNKHVNVQYLLDKITIAFVTFKSVVNYLLENSNFWPFDTHYIVLLL